MSTISDPDSSPGYSLQPLVQHRTNAVEWKQLQSFITWLTCPPHRAKSPLPLRHTKPNSHHNVIIAIPYLDADYLMDDLDALKTILKTSEGSHLCKLNTPKTSDDSGKCNILKRLLYMEVENSLSDDRQPAISLFTLKRTDLRTMENWRFLFEDGYESCDHGAYVKNLLDPDISEETLFDIVKANLSAPRRICKTPEELKEVLENYIKSGFGTLATAVEPPTTDNSTESSEHFHIDDSLIRRYASVAYALRKDPDFPNAFAIDCEMVTAGAENSLARITMVDGLLRVVFDSFVLPKDPIEDYRTVYSGITEKSLEGVTVSLADVQSCLNQIVDSQTVLIGHSLENDLKVCEVAHFHVLDTALQYMIPRRHNKPSLKSLARSHMKLDLMRTSGHDSCDDAITTMYLAMEGVVKLNPAPRTTIDILGPEAYKRLLKSDDPIPIPHIYLYDPMVDEYKSALSSSISVEPTTSDESTVARFKEVVRENIDSKSYHIIVFRDFQKLCLRKLFEPPKNDDSTCLIKRVNPKAVCSYLSSLATNINTVVSCLEDDDIFVISNLSGDSFRVDILSLAMHQTNPSFKKKLKRLLAHIYALGYGKPEPYIESEDDALPTEIVTLYHRSHGIMLETLRRDHQVAARDRSNSWVVFLSKQESKKRSYTP
ncbi:exonuclease family protein [Babesia ovis]|uniref:Exonuclease family protein n=1 Tax=Babesia ovis TaxID=5869 RepID=A0A9W5TAR6_BABOV|nr:exonuclease family protein [Babesia ovis]